MTTSTIRTVVDGATVAGDDLLVPNTRFMCVLPIGSATW